MRFSSERAARVRLAATHVEDIAITNSGSGSDSRSSQYGAVLQQSLLGDVQGYKAAIRAVSFSGIVLAAALMTMPTRSNASDNVPDSSGLPTSISSANTSSTGAAATTNDGMVVRRIVAHLKPSTAGSYSDPTNYYSRNSNRFNLGIKGQTPPAAAPAKTKDAQAPAAAAAPAGPTSRALPSPIENPPFPFTDWTINSGFPIGESWDTAPSSLQHALFGTKLDNTHYRIGGWADAGIVMSNAKNSNLPDTYNLIPNHPQLDQLILFAQKMVDTTQKEHSDWGFYLSGLYGIDYRFTAATSYFSDQLSHRNNLYGFDPVLNWGEVYLPKVADGTVIQFGRYISPIDIEAQLSNQNYLYSHSIMFGVDPYTYTGINAQVRVNKCFEYMLGVTAGNENSPWSGASNANLEALIGWNAADNKDSLWGGLDSWTPSGRAVRGHDDEQIANFVWGHVFNPKLHMQTQAYYMWEWGALVGGTPITGPAQPFAGSGVGNAIPGKAYAIGFVNNMEYKVNKNDYITVRSGFLSDPQGWRTGAATDYSDITVGYSHLFARTYWIRPEIRWDHSYGAASWDNGTLKNLFSLAGDIIIRF